MRPSHILYVYTPEGKKINGLETTEAFSILDKMGLKFDSRPYRDGTAIEFFRPNSREKIAHLSLRFVSEICTNNMSCN
jgi:hypothetical protein